jgi:glycosyltransferase involved in cell wall biosynthesis
MIKVLILAYDFPPYTSVGGVRPSFWYEYFKDFGLYPIVVTRDWNIVSNDEMDYVRESKSKKVYHETTDRGLIIRAPYFPNLSNKLYLKFGQNRFKLLRKLFSAFDELGQFPFMIGSKVNLYHAAKNYLKENKVDFIIATGSPHILFKYASKLSNEFKIPWAADYRDPWSQSESRNRFGYLKRWNQHFEKNFIANCSFAITVSEFCVRKISSNINLPIHLIKNGYDDSIFKEKNFSEQTKKLTIVFAGTIYKWHPIESVLDGLYNLKLQGIEIKLKIIGTNDTLRIKKFISYKHEYSLIEIEFSPKMSGVKYVKEITNCNFLLLFNDYSLIGTKIYDYMAAKRKILLCYSEETVDDLRLLPYYNDEIEGVSTQVQQDLMILTDSGYVVRNKEHLIEILKNAHKTLMLEGKIESKTRDIEYYSRRHSIKMLSNIIINQLKKT